MQLDPARQRAFALDVVRQLRAAGFEALWAGGCVRDFLLGRTPKDYDVATNATPDQVRAVFRRQRTLAIGAAFGVIGIVGRGGAGTIEVATFRSDGGYSDGRHPDSVVFSDARSDAQRRDFTVNGLFYDPVSEQVIDFVGGQADLQCRLLRAIGAPYERFTEDRLRMLRAVRIAAQYELTIEPDTLAAIQQMAPQVLQVSAERIGQEMRGLLLSHRRRHGLTLLVESQLASAVLPEVLPLETRPAPRGMHGTAWSYTLEVLALLETPTLPLVLAAMLWLADRPAAAQVASRWRYSNDIRETAAWLARHADSLDNAPVRPWSQVQPLLVNPAAAELIQLHAARAAVEGGDDAHVQSCRDRLAWPADQLDPPPLLTGHDLATLGIPRGPQYARLLAEVRAAQLDGHLADRTAAIEFIERLTRSGGTDLSPTNP
jgi:poly(A) polymerase